jgi:DNA topoisomerase-6 subunit B
VHARQGARRVDAEALAERQRDIAVSEFFVKNRHLLGFDSPARALLTAVKEAVDNALDACEEAGILPEIRVEIEPRGRSIHRIAVEDNGPGIVEAKIGKIFGKLLYGSKFHTLSQSRGQQGMGIAAAGMYGQLTTGQPMRVLTRTSTRKPALELLLSIDTATNRPDIHRRARADWTVPHGTRVEIELEGHYQHGQHSIFEYLRQTALANPHATIHFEDPTAQRIVFSRCVRRLPDKPSAIKPHPHGIELGTLMAMLRQTRRRTLAGFFAHELSRVGTETARKIIQRAGRPLRPQTHPLAVTRAQARALHLALSETPVRAPAGDCIVPIGEAVLLSGLRGLVDARWYTAVTRTPAAYRGNPFAIEVALAFGRPEESAAIGGSSTLAADQPARIYRLANRTPLLFQASACAMTQAVVDTHWHGYGLSQPVNALPVGPIAILLHIASVWVPFTSEAKEAVARYPEIGHELALALHECGRRLAQHLAQLRRGRDEESRRTRIERYVPHIGLALQQILGLDDERREAIVRRLDETLRGSDHG